jgi:hypothetical protein
MANPTTIRAPRPIPLLMKFTKVIAVSFVEPSYPGGYIRYNGTAAVLFPHSPRNRTKPASDRESELPNGPTVRRLIAWRVPPRQTSAPCSDNQRLVRTETNFPRGTEDTPPQSSGTAACGGVGFYRQRILPVLVDRACGTAGLRKWRAELSNGLSGRVLEIGFGSGLNVDHYPLQQADPLVVADGFRPAATGFSQLADLHVPSP